MSYFQTHRKKDYAKRAKLITRIEGITGSLKSIPWNKISTEDLETLLNAMDKSV